MAEKFEPVPPPVVQTTGTAPPGATIVAMTPSAVHVPPEPEPTPPGGKFGIREFEDRDGKRVETIRYVDANGDPYVEKDADGNPVKPAPSKKGG